MCSTRAADSKGIRVVLVEDDPDIARHLGALLQETPDIELVRTDADGAQALERIPADPPHIVLMDIQMPGLSGVDCVRRLKPLCPQTEFLMLTVYEDSDRIFESLKAGASGYLLKRTPKTELLDALREVVGGGAPMNSLIARKVVRFFHPPPQRPETQNLTSREVDVLSRLAQGRAYKEIATELDLSIDTVRQHIKNIYTKLHAHNRMEAVGRYFGSH